jgi:large subunit ribosomal protein L22
MTGPKLNDGVLLLDGQVSTRATARFVRGSASKVRAVLDLIRGLDVGHADEVLRFTERAAAQDVRKVLASAVANAVHNESQDPEELFVLACYADEGPTLKRFRPRARGRASRIRKRTCHITVIVARMSDERLELLQARQAATPTARRRPGTTAASRRERVARSRARAESLRSGDVAEGEETTEDAVGEGVTEDVVTDADVAEEALETVEEEAEADAEPASAPPADVEADVEAEEPAVDEETEPEPTTQLPAGAVAAPDDGSVPDGFPVKGNASSKKFHVPGGRYYDITVAELFFDSVESAEAAGYEPPAADAKKVHGEDA